jgi:hypothetical protein
VLREVLLWLSLAVPVVATVAWFFFRLFEGRNVDDAEGFGGDVPPPLEPAPGPHHQIEAPAERPDPAAVGRDQDGSALT